jgi:hypothetical protein
MHTALVIAAGLLLLGLCLAVGRLIGGPGPAPLASAARSFIPVWFVGAMINLWVGVSQAGYTVAEELPIMAIVFVVPAAVAFGLWRWWLGKSRAEVNT